MSWVSQDITFCLSESCPIRKYCFRKVGPLPGIHSFSDYSEICNETNVYKEFIQANKEVREKYKQKEEKRGC